MAVQISRMYTANVFKKIFFFYKVLIKTGIVSESFLFNKRSAVDSSRTNEELLINVIHLEKKRKSFSLLINGKN